MSLNDLPDQTLNEMCCKALGWEWVNQRFSQWSDGEIKLERGWDLPDGTHLPALNPANPHFCGSLDLIQQYLVPVIRELPTDQQATFYYTLQRLVHTKDNQLEFICAGARPRVIAFLTALGVEHGP